ncbi:hypothetical protein MXB_1996 [Myxobolus squamalis]|nr:hypothetical protein MXB_1996 [Myxobolus squamalis]
MQLHRLSCCDICWTMSPIRLW